MTFVSRTALLAVLVAALNACSSSAERYDPDVRLGELIEHWRAMRDEGGPRTDPGYGLEEVRDPGRLRSTMERILLDYPAHVPTMMACALLAYDAGEVEKATRYLDEALQRRPSYADAAILRSRIALEQGNTRFAIRMLEEQIALDPGDLRLREALAGALYVSGQFEVAAEVLEQAGGTGVPPGWRLAYHRGLVAEAQGDRVYAAESFRLALKLNPACLPAEQRLKGLVHLDPSVGPAFPR